MRVTKPTPVCCECLGHHPRLSPGLLMDEVLPDGPAEVSLAGSAVRGHSGWMHGWDTGDTFLNCSSKRKDPSHCLLFILARGLFSRARTEDGI